MFLRIHDHTFTSMHIIGHLKHHWKLQLYFKILPIYTFHFMAFVPRNKARLGWTGGDGTEISSAGARSKAAPWTSLLPEARSYINRRQLAASSRQVSCHSRTLCFGTRAAAVWQVGEQNGSGKKEAGCVVRDILKSLTNYQRAVKDAKSFFWHHS